MPLDSNEAPTAKEHPPGPVADALFRRHFESLPSPAFIWRREGSEFRLVAHNPSAGRVAQSRVASVIGIAASELYADRPDIVAEMARSAADGIVLQREIDYRFMDGAVRRLLVSYVPLSGDVVVVHAQDVTDRLQTSLQLARSEQRMHALFASHPDIVFRMDAEGRFLDLHVPESEPFPWDRAQIIGRRVADYYGAAAQREQERHNRAALETGAVQVFEYRSTIGDETRHLESRVARAGENEVVVTVRNVSERVELESKLTVLAERERAHLGREIHDGLAQMLTGAKLLLENLEKRLIEERSQHAGRAAEAAALINETITHARELVRGLSPIPKGTSLFGGLDLLARNAKKYLGIACRTSFAGDASHIGETAVAHLYRIAQEAITNAVKHGRTTTIDLCCRIDGDDLELSIADRGEGMGQHTATTEGLGLRIMRHRARAIGGDIALAVRPDGGVAVTCRCRLSALPD